MMLTQYAKKIVNLVECSETLKEMKTFHLTVETLKHRKQPK